MLNTMNNSLKAIICTCLLLLLAIGQLEAKKVVVQRPVYMIGVAFSFVDSAVFITDMHQVDNVTLEKKTKFLADRQLYSFQLQKYLEATFKGGPYVPSVFFSTNRKKMERKYLSLHKRYVNGKELRMTLVDQGQFRFKPEEYIEAKEDPANAPANAKGKKKKKDGK